ncbi:MAG TPA: HAD family phosphatase [Terriglobales bacterium]|nr:HAD family phosphatase [Terriglobales bacterium]
MSTRRAVLWDMDGTLIDSEEFHWKSWHLTLQEEGIAITREQFLSTFGQRNDAIISQWLGPAATPEQAARIADSKENMYRHLVRRDGISPLPGVADWVRRLHRQGWRQAIASSAPRANIETVLEALSATHIFDAVVAGEDVQKGKPDPEVYLLAAERVGVAPGFCIVVEDAVAGIEAARAAGMRSVGVGEQAKNLRGADVAVRSLDLLNPDAFNTLLHANPAVMNA